MAEGAFALLLGLLRRVKPMQAALAADGWAWPTETLLGADLAGKDSGYAVRAVGAHLWDQHGDRIKQVHGMRKCMRMSIWHVRM